jgi:hypothetical protein
MQCAQSNDKFWWASLRSEEVTGGTKMKAQIATDSRTNAACEQTHSVPYWHALWSFRTADCQPVADHGL